MPQLYLGWTYCSPDKKWRHNRRKAIENVLDIYLIVCKNTILFIVSLLQPAARRSYLSSCQKNRLMTRTGLSREIRILPQEEENHLLLVHVNQSTSNTSFLLKLVPMVIL